MTRQSTRNCLVFLCNSPTIDKPALMLNLYSSGWVGQALYCWAFTPGPSNPAGVRPSFSPRTHNPHPHATNRVCVVAAVTARMQEKREFATSGNPCIRASQIDLLFLLVMPAFNSRKHVREHGNHQRPEHHHQGWGSKVGVPHGSCQTTVSGDVG